LPIVDSSNPNSPVSTKPGQLHVRHSGTNRLQTIKAVQKGARGAFGRDEWEERIAGDKPNLKLAKGTALEPLAKKSCIES